MSSPVTGTTLDPRAFRSALGSFVTGVTIVTTRDADAGHDVGLTVNSFNSVSLDPPLILWSLALSSRHLPVFREAEWWAVHVLSSEQQALSAQFASAAADKFAGVPVMRGPGDTPLLEGCAARFICHTAYEHEGGDHAIFVGHVVQFDRAGRPPLIYHEGRYGSVVKGETVDRSDAAGALPPLLARGAALAVKGQLAAEERLTAEEMGVLVGLLGRLVGT
jgi:3-hydroxy-9,10-secoandrosta-1,3,5(10)-triene-9,17-dione monooxygenase reductase component